MMLATRADILPVITAATLFQSGNGLMLALLPLRMQAEGLSATAVGAVATAYGLGFWGPSSRGTESPIGLGRLCGKPCQQGFRAPNHSARGFRLQIRGRGTRCKAVPRTAGKHMYFSYFFARPV
jgi:hypothetical protein